jgi:hypothetical protein
LSDREIDKPLNNWPADPLRAIIHEFTDPRQADWHQLGVMATLPRPVANRMVSTNQCQGQHQYC